MAKGGASESVNDRSVRFRKRGDLVVRPMRGGTEQVWRIKDPVALTYFELTDQEYFLLAALDGKSSLSDLCERFERRFAPLRITPPQLQVYLGELREGGLVVDDSPGDVDPLRDERSRRKRNAAWQGWLNILAWRFRGTNPTWLLDRILPGIRSIPRFVRWPLLGLFPAAALLLLATRPAAIRERLPAAAELLAPGFLLWLWIGIAFSRVIHEIAHAAVCRLRGGECPEMGVLLLMFTPCLYCDVSDAWLMPDRTSRLLISAAGMIAELEIAAICFLLWWFTEPGGMHSAALALAVVCSVNSLFLNGNPLLRYDGYYLLSDALNEPNLGRKGEEFWRSALGRAVLGVKSAPGSAGLVRNPVNVAIYGALSGVYRPLVLAAAAWGICLLLASIGQRELGIAAAWLLPLAMLADPIRRAWSSVANPAWRAGVDRRRLAGWGGGAVVLLLAAMSLPLPRRVTAVVVVDAPSAPRVYVTVEGRLVEGVADGCEVVAGSTLARLENPALQREVDQLEADAKRSEYQLRQLEALRREDSRAAAQIPASQEALASIRSRLTERRRDLKRLHIVATCSGRFVPPPFAGSVDSESTQISQWQGRPLDPSNRGCWLSRGTVLGQVVDPTRTEVSLKIDPGDIDLIRPGQEVRLRLAQAPGGVFRGEIVDFGTQTGELQVAAPEAVQSLTMEGRSGRPKSQYWARVRMVEPAPGWLLGDQGEARISTTWAPLLPRLVRLVRQTFRIER